MITRTFLSKTNTIYRDENVNTGLSPICSLYYGKLQSRVLLYFDLNKIINLYKDKTYPLLFEEIDGIKHYKLKHKLKMYNCSDVRIEQLNYPMFQEDRERTQSFDLSLYALNKNWDNGRGFDYSNESLTDGKLCYSTNGSNWFNSDTINKWDFPGAINNNTDEEDNTKSILIGSQHFEYGNENLEIDITDYIDNLIFNQTEPITEEKDELGNIIPPKDYNFYGFCLCFDKKYEDLKTDLSQYCGFFSSKTNSIFQPFIETTYEDIIQDDRTNFILGKTNKLYFYASVGSKMVNLDNLPTVAINGFKMASKQATKGIYYVELNTEDGEYEENTMYYDVWSDLSYNNIKLPDVELYFTPKTRDNYFSFGLPYETKPFPKFTPCIYGIKELEKIKRGDIRKLTVDCKLDYTNNQTANIDDLEYRLYTTIGNKQFDIIEWDKIEKGYNSNEFIINTNELLPCKYFIDIKASYGKEIRIYEKMLEFEVISDYLK